MLQKFVNINEAPRADARGIFSFFGGIRRSSNSHSSPPKAGFSAKADKYSKYLVIIPLIFSGLVLSINLNKPFVGHHDFMGAMEGMIAKNYLKFGVWDLKFGQITGIVDEIPKNAFFTHYPPLLPLLIALSFSLFGIVEWAERLVPATFSLLSVLFFFLTCQKLWNPKIAILAAIFFVFNPMYIYFGSLPAPEPLILSTAITAFYFYLRWLEGEKNSDLILLCLVLFIGGLIGWPIDYFGPLVILHSLLINKFNLMILIPTLVLIGSLLLQIAHNFILTGSILSEEIISTLKFRLTENNLSFGGQQFTFINYVKQEISWLQVYFTRTTIILSAIYTVFNLNFRFDIQKASVLFWLLFGLAHPIIFNRYVFIHDFLNIYLLPFFAMSAALGLEKIVSYFKIFHIDKKITIVFVFVVLIIFANERLAFTKALLNTRMNQEGKDMAMILNSLQKNSNEAAIVSPRFASFYGIFANFYSNRPYQVISEDDLTKKNGLPRFKYIITIDQDISDKQLYSNLSEKYQTQKKDNITIIYTNEKR